MGSFAARRVVRRRGAAVGALRHHGSGAVPQRWRALFVLGALVAQLSAVALPGTRSMPVFLASCGVLMLVISGALALPRLGTSSSLALLIPCGYLISLALLFASQDSASTGLQPLVLLPIVWAALYHRPRDSAALVLAAVCMLVVASLLAHAPVAVVIRTAGLWGLAGAILVLGAHNLRSWLGDAIAEREETLRQAWVLGDVARELNSTLDSDRVVAIGVRLAAEIASPPGSRARRANYCRIADGMVRVDAEFDGEGQWLGAAWPLREHPLLAQAVRTGFATSGALDPAELGPAVRYLAAAQGVGHGGWVPVTVDGVLHGVLAVAGRNRPVSEQELSRCVAISQIMELALQNALTHELAQRAALIDPLTSLSNRRGMEQLVLEGRGHGPLAVVAIDVDQLKEVNDGHGHAAGDELLQLVADAIRSVRRAGDVVARLGGDEFACVMFDSDEHAGRHVATRLLEAVRHARYRGCAARLSIGIACAAPGASLKDGIRRADLAMYEAKRAGGMRYRLAAAEPLAELGEREAAA
jgi:diguanylate cyclase (GGDEF)-like protein